MQGIPLRPDYAAAQRAAADLITRAVIAAGIAKFDGKITPIDFARKKWGDSRTVQYIERAASGPAMTTTTGWAAELSHVAQMFIGLLVPVSAAAAVLNRGLQINFNGLSSISFPSISQSAATFTGQAKPIPVAQFVTGAGAKLESFALKLITVATYEMLASSNAEAMLKAVLIEGAALGLDQALFSANAGTADNPPGLLVGVTATPSSTQTIPTEAMLSDVAKLAGAVARVAGGSSNIIFVAAPEQESFIKSYEPQFAFPLLASSALPNKTVIAVAGNAFITAYGPLPEIDTARETELHMDSAPLAIVPPGSPAVMSSPVGSLVQTDRVAFRMRLPVAWALRTSGAIAFVNNASWPA
jgi:hypothetical protein